MSTVMFKKNLYAFLKFDEDLACHEDWDQFLRLSRKGIRFFYIDTCLSDICVHPEALSQDIGVMNKTRDIVGKRAKDLWRDFKKEMNIYSVQGISNFARYLFLKFYSQTINFPRGDKFNRKVSYEIFT